MDNMTASVVCYTTLSSTTDIFTIRFCDTQKHMQSQICAVIGQHVTIYTNADNMNHVNVTCTITIF